MIEIRFFVKNKIIETTTLYQRATSELQQIVDDVNTMSGPIFFYIFYNEIAANRFCYVVKFYAHWLHCKTFILLYFKTVLFRIRTLFCSQLKLLQVEVFNFPK